MAVPKFFKNRIVACVCAQSLSRVWLFVIPWTAAHQASLSVEFPSQEYWSGLPFPTAGDLPTQGLSSILLHWQQAFNTAPPGKPNDLSMPLPKIYLKEQVEHQRKYICTPMIIAAVFTMLQM